MAHTHHSHCVHDNMKYCRDCQVPYCVSCGKEWRTTTTTIGGTFPYWQYGHTWYTTKNINTLGNATLLSQNNALTAQASNQSGATGEAYDQLQTMKVKVAAHTHN